MAEVESTITKITEERCAEIGGHCYDLVEWDSTIHTASSLFRECRHCGKCQQLVYAGNDAEGDEKATSDAIVSDCIYIEKPGYISEAECLHMGGHCMVEPFYRSAARWCKHCGYVEIGQFQSDTVWKDVEASVVDKSLARRTRGKPEEEKETA